MQTKGKGKVQEEEEDLSSEVGGGKTQGYMPFYTKNGFRGGVTGWEGLLVRGIELPREEVLQHDLCV